MYGFVKTGAEKVLTRSEFYGIIVQYGVLFPRQIMTFKNGKERALLW